MKKKFLAIVTAALIGTTAFAATASAASGIIDVISREDGSGTRGAFIELFGIEEKQGDEKVDMTTEDASITNSTSVMMTTVAGDENAIGYISLGSLNDTVKAVKIDGAEASAEGVAMCRDRKRSKALVSATVNPYVLETIKTYCFGNEMEIEVIPEKDGLTDMEYLKEHVDAQTACVLIQHPNYYGNLEEAAEIGEITHGAGAKYVMNVNPISLGVVKTPAEYGADVAVGEGQPLGLSIAFGGPYLGFMAATQKMMRNLPGRIVGQTEDHNGKKGYVLTLQAREQHIRREKASSNICSNQALCALAVGVYLATMGNEGIKKAATLSTSKAHYLSAELAKVGYQTENKGEFFHEFVTVSDVPVAKALAALEEKGILGGFPLDEHRILWCCTEVNTKEEMDAVVQILKEVQ